MRTKHKILKSTLLAGLLATYIGTVGAQSPAATPAAVAPAVMPARVIEDSSVRPGWKRYQLGDKPVFSVIFPGLPETSAERAPESSTAVLHLYISTDASGVYLAQRIEGIGLDIERGPEADRQKFFRNYVEGFAKGFQESMNKDNIKHELKLLEPTKVSVAGREAFQQDMTIGTLHGRAQVVFAGSKVFTILVIWTPQATPADYEGFLKSFQLSGIAN